MSKNDILENSKQVGLFHYWIIPVLSVLRHPLNHKEWYVQISRAIEVTSGGKVESRSLTYHIKKVKDL